MLFVEKAMNANEAHSRKMKICHLASGDLWAGAEVQVLNVCRGLLDTGAVDVSAIVLNDGRLAEELRSIGLDVSVFEEGVKSRSAHADFRRSPANIPTISLQSRDNGLALDLVPRLPQ